MRLTLLNYLKYGVWIVVFLLMGCTSHEHFNRPTSNQSGAKAVPSWCRYSAGPEALLLFYLADTKVEVSLYSDKNSQKLYINILSKESLAAISDKFSILIDGNKVNILGIKESTSSHFDKASSVDFYFSDMSIKVSGDYKDFFTIQGLEIVVDGVAYPIEDITFKKDEDTFLTPWNC